MWLDPSDMTTLYQDRAGTTLVTAVGQNVGKMLDKSGNGWHRVAATDGQRGILRQDGNGKYYIEHTVAANTALAGAISGWGASMAFGAVFQSASAANNHVLWTKTPSSDFIGARQSGNTSAPDSIASDVATMLNGVKLSPNTRAQLFTDTGTNLLLEEDLLCDVSGWADISIGGYGSGFAFGGSFYGALVYQPATPAEVALARTYLAGLAGLTVPTYTGAIGYAIGDSTIASYLGQNSVTSYMTSATSPIVNLAVPNENIVQQQTVWNATTSNHAYAKWVIIEVGLNDLDITDAATPALSTAAAIARLQALVDDVRSDVSAGTKVLISKMTPCRQRLIDIYGATNGPLSYQKWLDINTAIAGGGSTPITNVDGRITAHEPLLNDGSGNLAAAYEVVGFEDGIHENNAGRQIIADAWEDALTALGIL
jgi:lysophospholipase L1-like esterase